jgi:hypothetical protein
MWDYYLNVIYCKLLAGQSAHGCRETRDCIICRSVDHSDLYLDLHPRRHGRQARGAGIPFTMVKLHCWRMSDGGMSHCHMSDTARKVTVVCSIGYRNCVSIPLQTDGRMTTQCECELCDNFGHFKNQGTRSACWTISFILMTSYFVLFSCRTGQIFQMRYTYIVQCNALCIRQTRFSYIVKCVSLNSFVI